MDIAAAATLFLLVLTPSGATATSSKMDFLPLGAVRTDPVTTPTGLSPHVHTFYGAAASLRPDTDYDELRKACGNSGNVDDNKSLYWHPTIYKYNPSSKKYETVPISFASAYYVWLTGSTRAFPDGFQMIARQSSGGKARVNFDCNGPSNCERTDGGCGTATACPEGKTDGSSVSHQCFPTKQCSELEMKIVFPACWDGVSLTSSDFMSHVAYTEGNWGDDDLDERQSQAYGAECPSSHPVRIPEIQFYFRIQNYEGGQHLFSDGGSSVHADYFSGWNKSALQKVLDECDNDSEAASSDAWCETHLKFRDTPKQKGDERIIEKLSQIQPSQDLLNYRQTVSAEAVDEIPVLPSGSGTLIPLGPDNLDWRSTPNCSSGYTSLSPPSPASPTSPTDEPSTDSDSLSLEPASPTSPTDEPSTDSDSSSLETEAIAGIVVGSVAFVVIVIIIVAKLKSSTSKSTKVSPPSPPADTKAITSVFATF